MAERTSQDAKAEAAEEARSKAAAASSARVAAESYLRNQPLDEHDNEDAKTVARARSRRDGSLPSDFVSETGLMDESAVSGSSMRGYTLADGTPVPPGAWLRWVNSPEDWSRHTGVDRIRQEMDWFPGAQVVRNEDGDLVRNMDQVLVARPAHYKEEHDEVERERQRAYFATNPMLAMESGLSDDEIDEIIEQQDEQLREIRKGQRRLKDMVATRKQAHAERARLERMRMMQPSTTYGMSYQDAASYQIASIMRERGVSREVARQYHEQYIDHLESSARIGPRHDRNPDSWSRMVESQQAATDSGMSFRFAGVEFGRKTEEAVRDHLSAAGAKS